MSLASQWLHRYGPDSMHRGTLAAADIFSSRALPEVGAVHMNTWTLGPHLEDTPWRPLYSKVSGIHKGTLTGL